MNLIFGTPGPDVITTSSGSDGPIKTFLPLEGMFFLVDV